MNSLSSYVNKLASYLYPSCADNSSLPSFPPSFFQPPLENPEFRLTGAILHSELTLDTFSQAIDAYGIQGVALEKNAKSAFFGKSIAEETLTLYYRNCLAKILWLDDHLRLKNTQLDASQKGQIGKFLTQIERHLKEAPTNLIHKDTFGELIRLYAALKYRVEDLQTPLSQEEKNQLFSKLHELRKKEALHLLLPSKSQLFEMSFEEIESLKKANREIRLTNLELICPLNVGLSQQELETFILDLPKATQEELTPLIQARKNAISSDTIWEKLVNKRLEEKKNLHKAFDLTSALVEKDYAELVDFPHFARALIEYGSFFLEDFFSNCHVMKITNLKSYFTAPHVIILLAEQHLNKQMFAAKECLQTSETDSSILLVQSSLDGTHKWVPANTISFRDIYVSDPLHRLIGREQLRKLSERMESSSQAEENRMSYLPGKGICQYDPTLIPEKIEQYLPFDTSAFEDSFTPAISYAAPESCLLGTHAFVELYFNHKRYAPGKYSTFNYSYDKINTYWKIATFLLPKIFKNHEGVIFSPDPALGYKNHTRHIAVLQTPLKISPQQKEAMYRILRSNYLGEKGEGFIVHTKNCTTITEDFLQVAGVNMPCRAPLASLLAISYPSFAPFFKWINEHPNISTPLLQFLGWLFGAENNNPLTVQSLQNIATPYIPRIWVELKNCVEEIETIR